MTAYAATVIPQSDGRIIRRTGYQPRWFQQQIHANLKRFSVLVLHRRAGKTVLAINQLIHGALTCTKQNPQFGYIAPFLKQAKKAAWKYLKLYTADLYVQGLIKYNEQALTVTFLANNATVELVGADDPDAIRGTYYDGVVMDEVAQMKADLWQEVVRPMLADRNGWAVFIGTPKGINLFYELYQRALVDDEWYACLLTVYDTNALPEAEVEAARKEMTENKFRQEFLCDFTASTEDTIIDLDLIEAAAGRHLEPGDYQWAPKIISIDSGRYGDDDIVITKRQGLACFGQDIFEPSDRKTLEMELAAQVANTAALWGRKGDNVALIAIDTTGGYGGGCADRLRQLRFPCVDVNFGQRLKGPYANMRTKIMFDTRDWLIDGGSIPNDPVLKQDMAAPTYGYNAQNQIVAEPKDKTKERLQRSPDHFDSLATGFAYPVAGHTADIPNLNSNEDGMVTDHDYDPLSPGD